MKSFAAAALLGSASATTLNLKWTDCGGAATITDLQPTSMNTGSTTTITGSGSIPTAVQSGTFEATIKTSTGVQLVDCKGDIGPVKKCNLPFGAGSVQLDAIKVPIAAGVNSISLDVSLSSMVPAMLLHSNIAVRASDESGTQVVCMDVQAAPAADDVVV